jgi:hypothetical protein
MEPSTKDEENEMSEGNRDRKRKLAILGGVGLALAMFRAKRRMNRYAMGQTMGGYGFGGHGHGRFRGRGPWAYGGPKGQLPPFIEETLKAWHDRAHGTVPPASPGTEPTRSAQV